jgi:hypothetical protein
MVEVISLILARGRKKKDEVKPYVYTTVPAG